MCIEKSKKVKQIPEKAMHQSITAMHAARRVSLDKPNAKAWLIKFHCGPCGTSLD
jgi:hypothetical protein